MKTALLVVSVVGLMVAGGCGTLEKAAAKDPARCERDPDCAATRAPYRDCYTQCNDDPPCVDRCREMSPDSLGHK
jgi:hypothetical protein